MIIKIEDQAPFVEGLDSRTSLFQPGENDANVGDQAWDDQAYFQALGQAHFQAKIVSKVDFNQDFSGHLFEYSTIYGLVLRSKLKKELKGPSWRSYEPIWNEL